MKAYINSISYYLPDNIITNEQIAEKFPDWTPEKVKNKIGIVERRVVSENETASDLAVKAANRLFDEHKIDRNTIDYLIFCTQSPDYILPTTACLIQDRLNLSINIGAIDISLGCSGFIYGISLAKGLIFGGMAKNVLLITAETYSKYIHPQDKGNQTIFGDAAAATLISESGFAEIMNFSFGTDGRGADNLIVKTGAARTKEKLNDIVFDEKGNLKSSDYLFMDGSEIVNYTLDYMPLLAKKVLEVNNLQLDDINWFVFHQANKFIMDLLRKKLNINVDKYYSYYSTVGNTVSSTIPIAFYEAKKELKFKKDDYVMLVAPGLGYSWGGCVLKINN